MITVCIMLRKTLFTFKIKIEKINVVILSLLCEKTELGVFRNWSLKFLPFQNC